MSIFFFLEENCVYFTTLEGVKNIINNLIYNFKYSITFLLSTNYQLLLLLHPTLSFASNYSLSMPINIKNYYKKNALDNLIPSSKLLVEHDKFIISL